MLWQQNAYRENAFVGNGAYGWFRPPGLGQAEIRFGTGFVGPFGIFSDMPSGSFAVPPGMPRTTGEIGTPWGWATDLHCYQLQDGSYARMSRAQAMAMGLREPVDADLCPGPQSTRGVSTAVMSGRKMGQAYKTEPGKSIFESPTFYGIPVIPAALGIAAVGLILALT